MSDSKKQDLTPYSFRIWIVSMLCVLFTFFSWHLALPHAQKYLSVKEERNWLNTVMGSKEAPKDSTAFRNFKRFQKIPDAEQLYWSYKYSYNQESQGGIIEALKTSFSHFQQLPLLLKGWWFFATIACICLLLKIPGAQYASYLPPLLLASYLITVPTFQSDPLIPSEALIIKEHIKEPLSDNVSEKRLQFKRGWESYLITHYLKQKPQTDEKKYALQLEEATHFFARDRLHHPYPPVLISLFPGNLLLWLTLFFNLTVCLRVLFSDYPHFKKTSP